MAGVGCDSSSALLAVAGAIAVLMVVEIFGCCFVAAAVVYHDLNGWLLRVLCVQHGCLLINCCCFPLLLELMLLSRR
jgi:hypothetical protein